MGSSDSDKISVNNSISSVERPKSTQKITKKISKKDKLYNDVKLSKIKNKIKRNELVQKQLQIKSKIKSENKKNRDEDYVKQTPITTDDKRKIAKDFISSANELLEKEESFDVFSDFIKNKKETKILLTTSKCPSRKAFDLLKDIKYLIPNCYFYPRKKFSFQEVVKNATEKGFTHVVVVACRLKVPKKIRVYYLPNGPYIVYKIIEFKTSFELFHRATDDFTNPELIIKGFNTALGRRVGRSLASLFPGKPEYRYRNVVTFLNKRDFIFLRNHRYEFKEYGEKVNLQEIGPRMSLQLEKISNGLLREELEWQYQADMYVNRSNGYL